ncbi:MAG: hypothetical protein AAFQ65_07835, partial [Myxococcota bacterium]
MFAAFSGASYGIALIALLLVLGHTLYIGVPYIIHFYDNAVRHNANRPSFRGYLRAFAVEWWFALAANLSYPFGLFGRGLRDGYDPAGGPPIVFIHGYMMNRACFFVLYWRLRRMGYRNLYALNLRPLIGALSGQAEGLERLLRMVASGAPNRPLYLIGHSQGGLLLRWVAGGVGHGLNIGKIITLGSPHHGTRIAHLGIGANARDLEPGSASLTGLPEKLEAPLVAFYSDLDQIILPAESAKFGDENRFFSETGHFALLYRAPVFASILKELPPVVAADSMAATASAIESQRHAATTRDASAAAGEGARQVAADHVSSGLGSSSQARTVDNGIVEAEGSAVAAMDASTDDDTQHLAIPERSAAAEASAVRAADDRAAPGMADGGDASDGAGAGANASYEANADDEN